MRGKGEELKMKRMFKALSLLLVVVLALLMGCGNKEEAKSENVVNKQQEVSQPAESKEEAFETVENADVEEKVSEIVTDAVAKEDVIVEEASKGEDIDYLQIHGITLDRIYAWTMKGIEGTHVADGEQVIVDAVKEFGEYARYDLGYAITEVNEDGILELVIGQVSQDGIGNMIYAIYTWKDGNFQCNAKGAEYGKIAPGRVNDAVVLYLAPFSNYEPGMKVNVGNMGTSVEVLPMEEPPVCAQTIENVYLEPNGYDVFTADDGAGQQQVVFIAISKVSDFKVLALTFENVDENGNVKYTTKELYSQAVLTPEHPLVTGMSCDSTISCYGISYVDVNGITRNFAIEVSGMDGSILLNEF